MTAVQSVLMAPKEAAFRYVCRKCGWKWFPRSAKLPDRCPNQKCATKAWNREELKRGRKPHKKVRK